jgi:aspartate/methionine/tyrosine aminotransferase
MREAYRERRERVVQGLGRIPGVRCAPPAGAFYAWPNVSELCRAVGAEDSEHLRRRLLDEAGVALLSDIHFGPRIEGEGEHLRLSFASSGNELERGLTRMAGFAREAMRPTAVAPPAA